MFRMFETSVICVDCLFFVNVFKVIAIAVAFTTESTHTNSAKRIKNTKAAEF